MLPSAPEEHFTDSHHAAYADGELSRGIEALIGMAVVMTQGCYTGGRYYLGVAKDEGIAEGAIREAMAAVTATNGGRPRAQAREALKGMVGQVPVDQAKGECCHG